MERLSHEQILGIFRHTGALLSGHFELRSKLHSDEYFQCAQVLRFPHHAETLCKEAVRQMKKAMPTLRVDGVISPALGGIPVGHEVARALHTQHLFAEKQLDKLVLRRGFHIHPGENWVVAEDVVTRGGRVKETMDIVTDRGGHVAAIIVLVDRSGGRHDLGQVPLFSLLQMTPQTWTPEECPLCRQGRPIEHPGS